MIATDFIDGIPEADVRARLGEARDAVAIPPEAIARAIAFAVEQPADVDVNEIVVRPTAQD
jgi:NADP-dependent 3-hydroxy acid dehydrogenase YdfG